MDAISFTATRTEKWLRDPTIQHPCRQQILSDMPCWRSPSPFPWWACRYDGRDPYNRFLWWTIMIVLLLLRFKRHGTELTLCSELGISVMAVRSSSRRSVALSHVLEEGDLRRIAALQPMLKICSFLKDGGIRIPLEYFPSIHDAFIILILHVWANAFLNCIPFLADCPPIKHPKISSTITTPIEYTS